MTPVVLKLKVRDPRSAVCERCVESSRAKVRTGLYLYELGWRAGRIVCRDCLREESPHATILPTRGVS